MYNTVNQQAVSSALNPQKPTYSFPSEFQNKQEDHEDQLV